MNVKFTKVYVLFIFLVPPILLNCCAGKGENRTVARVGWEKITLKDINQRLSNVPVSYQEYLASEMGKKQLLEVLIRQKIMITMAKKNNIDSRKEILQSVKDFKKDFSARLKQYREELIIESYLKELEGSMLKIGDDEVESYYKEHKKDFQRPTEVQLSHILIATPEDAENVVNKIKGGSSFEELAEKLSLDPTTAEKQGDLGKLKNSEILPEFLPTVKGLAVGEYSKKPVKTQFGYHILKKTSERILPSQTKEESEKEIRKMLLKEKFDKWIEEQKKKLKVKIDYSLLK